MKRSKVDSRKANRVAATAAVALIVMAVLALSSTSRAGGAGDPTQDIVPNEVVVEIKPGASIDSVNARNNTVTKRPMNGTNFYLLKTPHSASAQKWQKRLRAGSQVTI